MIPLRSLLRFNKSSFNYFQGGRLSCCNIKHYSSEVIGDGIQETFTERKDKKLSKAMKAYVERSRKYNEFMKKEEEDFKIGKRHLANMMGHDPESFTQEQIDEAIEYLFPSGLFEKKARPFMKPPSLVFPPKKDAQFDESGRPYNFLFYTGKPNFYNLLHDLVENLNKLNQYEDEMINSQRNNDIKPLDLSGSQWVTKEDLERKLVEDLKDYEYKNYISALDWLAQHKFSTRVAQFINEQRKPLMEMTTTFTPLKPLVDEDGRLYITTKDCYRKSAKAEVTVRSPGTGKITINGEGIEYFKTVQGRNQILFPLEFTDMTRKIDLEATVSGGGETGQAGAIRWGISWGLRSFVSSEMVEIMRLAGLLTRDYRRRERKKPGQAGARRKYTWKKR